MVFLSDNQNLSNPPNPLKTQSCVFHLRNSQADRSLNISWQGTAIAHCNSPSYLGVTLDRSLTFKDHCLKTKQKVGSRNILLRKLTTITWGTSPHVLRTTGLALCFSAGEYACPVWHRSAHAREVDVALNETCRTVTGCLKPTPLNSLYPAAGIAPLPVRREIACAIEKCKQEVDDRHPLYGTTPAQQRLRSRRSFLRATEALTVPGRPEEARCNMWQEHYKLPAECSGPAEKLPAGRDLPWPTWKSLNRLRTQVGRCKDNMSKWGYSDQDSMCVCGTGPQSMPHLLACPECPSTCTLTDLWAATDDAIKVAEYWSKLV